MWEGGRQRGPRGLGRSRPEHGPALARSDADRRHSTWTCRRVARLPGPACPRAQDRPIGTRHPPQGGWARRHAPPGNRWGGEVVPLRAGRPARPHRTDAATRTPSRHAFAGVTAATAVRGWRASQPMNPAAPPSREARAGSHARAHDAAGPWESEGGASASVLPRRWVVTIHGRGDQDPCRRRRDRLAAPGTGSEPCHPKRPERVVDGRGVRVALAGGAWARRPLFRRDQWGSDADSRDRSSERQATRADRCRR